MTPQERDLITTLLTRLKSTAGQPKDAEAEAQIRQAMTEQPDAPYYLVQTVLIQDLSLHQAQNRIAELERQVTDAQSKPTSFLGSLFGSREPAPPAPTQASGPWTRGPQVAPPPQGQGYAQPGYAPQQGYAQPGYGGAAPGGGFGSGGFGGGGGGGFLRSAAATAAGVAGGALLFQGISSLFGHGYANSLYGGMGGGYNPGLGETVINNYYGDNAQGGGDYGGGGDTSGAGDYGGGGGGDYAGGGDYGGGGDAGGGDFGGGDTSC